MAEEGKLAKEAVQMRAGAEEVVVMVVRMSEAAEAEGRTREEREEMARGAAACRDIMMVVLVALNRASRG